MTHIGTPVIIADDHSQPADVTHPGPMLSAIAEDEMEAAVAKVAEKSLPPQDRADNMQQPVSVLVSRADREIYILHDGNIVAKGSVEIVRGNEPLGSHVFMLAAAHDSKRSLQWTTVSFKIGGAAGSADVGPAILDRLKPEVTISQRIRDVMHPGLVLVLTDLPAHPETRSARDFVVMTQQDS